MQDEPVIHVRGCSKHFRIHRKAAGLRGSVRSLFDRQWTAVEALTGVDLDVAEGEILGLVGANGAGKTTLVKILSGIIHPDAGQVRVLGHNPWRRHNDFRSRIALIMGQKAQLWWDLPAGDCFLLLREIYRIPRDAFQTRLDELAGTLQVGELLTTQIRRLSLGERMKMELVATLLHQPRVIFLDEPTIGLDLTAQRAIRQFLLDYNQRYRPAMIVTSHYMEDIKSLCRRIVIIKKGRIVYDGSLALVVSDHIRHRVMNVELSPNGRHRAGSADAPIPSEIGRVLARDGDSLRLQIPRERAAAAVQYMFDRFEVADLEIEEDDISTVIESLQSEDPGP